MSTSNKTFVKIFYDKITSTCNNIQGNKYYSYDKILSTSFNNY